jgi:hypothetical protein
MNTNKPGWYWTSEGPLELIHESGWMWQNDEHMEFEVESFDLGEVVRIPSPDEIELLEKCVEVLRVTDHNPSSSMIVDLLARLDAIRSESK